MESPSAGRELTSAPLSLTRLPTYMTPEEMYKVTRGIAGEWGIEGYDVPRKAVTYGKEKHCFSKSLRKTQSEERLRVQGQIPAPGKYYPDVKFQIKSKTHRPVFKAARNTFIEAAMKLGAKSPGPGNYFETPKTQEKPDPKRIRGAAIGLSSGLNYLSTCEFYGFESPGPGAYFPQPKPGKEPKPANIKPSFFFHSHPPPKQVEKEILGPGKYYEKDYVTNIKDTTQKLYRDPVRTAAPRPIMPKSHPPTALEVRAKLTSYVPGVGHYERATAPLDGFITDPKKIRLALMKEKGTRFPEDVIKMRAFTKGPGTYNQEDDEDILKKKD